MAFDTAPAAAILLGPGVLVQIACAMAFLASNRKAKAWIAQATRTQRTAPRMTPQHDRPRLVSWIVLRM
jgi:hypothetical protein